MGEHSGSKYLRTIHPADGAGEPIRVDVYSVLVAFGVTCPGRQHAIKKLLCAGLRGKNSEAKDVSESIDAVRRAVQLLEQAKPSVIEEQLGEQFEASQHEYLGVPDGTPRYMHSTQEAAQKHATYRYRTLGQICRVVQRGILWAVEVPEETPKSKEHVFGTMHEAVLYAGHRKATTDRPFRAVSCGDKWTVEEVTEGVSQ